MRLHRFEERVVWREHGLHGAVLHEGQRVECQALLLRESQLVVESSARAELRREPLMTEIAVSGEPEGAADEHGTQQEHQRLLFGALHEGSWLLQPKR